MPIPASPRHMLQRNYLLHHLRNTTCLLRDLRQPPTHLPKRYEFKIHDIWLYNFQSSEHIQRSVPLVSRTNQ